MPPGPPGRRLGRGWECGAWRASAGSQRASAARARRATRGNPLTPAIRNSPRPTHASRRATRRSPRRTPRVSSARVAANHERRRAQLAATHAGHPRATRRSPRRTPRAARVARGAKPSCSLTSVPRRSVALHHRRIDFALIHAASRLFHLIAHSTLHRKSRSPRQRARGLRPSCHPALRAGVLGGDGSAARERARITAPTLAAPHASRAQFPATHAGRRATHASRAQPAANHERRRAQRGWHEGRSPRAL